MNFKHVVILFIVTLTTTDADSTKPALLMQNSHKACRTNSHCYLFVNKLLPWSEASSACQQAKAVLATSSGSEENEWMAAKARQLNFAASYLGLRFNPVLHEFVAETHNSTLPIYTNHQRPFQLIIAPKQSSGNANPILTRRKRSIKSRRYKIKVHRIKRFRYKKFYKVYRLKRKKKITKYRYLLKTKMIRVKRMKEKIIAQWKYIITWLTKINWKLWLSTIKGIKVKIWIVRITKIIDIVTKNSIDKVSLKWTSWWRKIERWYKAWLKKYSKQQITIIWKWKKFVNWLEKVNWRKYIVQLIGIDVKLWIGRLERIIWVVENMKYNDICDKLWSMWRTSVQLRLRIIIHKKTNWIKNEQKNILAIVWNKRLEWIRRYKVMSWIKYSNRFKSWKKQAMKIINLIITSVKSFKMKQLENENIIKMWHKIKETVKLELSHKPTGVKKYITWVKRLEWLETQNIEYIIKQSSNHNLNKYLNNITSMLKEENFEIKNENVIGTYFKKLEVEVKKQVTIVTSTHIHKEVLIRSKRSISGPVKYMQLPTKYNNSLTVTNAIKLLTAMQKKYPFLESYLRSAVIRLFYYANRVSKAKLSTNQMLFKKLLLDQLNEFHKIGFPKNIWSLISALKLPGMRIQLNKGACITLQPFQQGNFEVWMTTECSEPKNFICRLTK